jgi:capsular polysaccharide export protein
MLKHVYNQVDELTNHQRFLLLGIAGTETLRDMRRLFDACGECKIMRFIPLGSGFSQRRDEAAQHALTQSIRAPAVRWLRDLRFRLYGAQYAGARALFERDPDMVAVCWNGLNGSRLSFMQAAKDAGARTLFLELSPLPGRITLDPSGVNASSCLPRSIQPYLDWLSRHTGDPSHWRTVGADLKQRPPNSSNRKRSSEGIPNLDSDFIFVPLQVPNDSQLRVFGGEFRTVERYLETLIDLSDSLPAGWHIRVKDHPSASSSVLNTVLRLKASRRVFLDNETDTFTQVARSKAVFTVNSSVGLQAFFHDRPVVVSGDAFWAIDGLVCHARTPADLALAIAEPQALGFVPRARDAFMTFISEVYYPRRPDFSDPSGAEVQQWRDEVAARLQPGWPHL